MAYPRITTYGTPPPRGHAGLYSHVIIITTGNTSHKQYLQSNTQFCKIKRMGWCGCPPPPTIIFERLNWFPQQIIYRRKGNLSESRIILNIGKIF